MAASPAANIHIRFISFRIQAPFRLRNAPAVPFPMRIRLLSVAFLQLAASAPLGPQPLEGTLLYFFKNTAYIFASEADEHELKGP